VSAWWSSFVHSLTTRQFALVVLQTVVWLGMAAVWVWAVVVDPDGWRMFLAVASTMLALFWTGILLVAIRERRSVSE